MIQEDYRKQDYQKLLNHQFKNSTFLKNLISNSTILTNKKENLKKLTLAVNN